MRIKTSSFQPCQKTFKNGRTEVNKCGRNQPLAKRTPEKSLIAQVRYCLFQTHQMLQAAIDHLIAQALQ